MIPSDSKPQWPDIFFDSLTITTLSGAGMQKIDRAKPGRVEPQMPNPNG
jgi:hypothetical protein